MLQPGLAFGLALGDIGAVVNRSGVTHRLFS